MRGILFGGWSSTINLALLLGLGAWVTSGVAMSLGYGKRLEKNGCSSFTMQPFLLAMA